jgi:hypothetical protein
VALSSEHRLMCVVVYNVLSHEKSIVLNTKPRDHNDAWHSPFFGILAGQPAD